MRSLSPQQEQILAANPDPIWLFEVAGHCWSTRNIEWDGRTYAAAVEPGSFSGVRTARCGAEMGTVSGHTADLTVAAEVVTEAEVEGEDLIIRLVCGSGADPVEIRSWWMTVQSASTAYGVMRIACVDGLTARIDGADWPNTPMITSLFPGSQADPAACLPVVLGTAWCEAQPVAVSGSIRYLLGPDGVYTVDKVASPRDWPGRSVWSGGDYAFPTAAATQGTETVRTCEPKVNDADGDGIADACGVWMSGRLLPPLLRVCREDTAGITNHADAIAWILTDMGIPAERIDTDTVSALRAELAARGVIFGQAWGVKQSRAVILSNLLAACGATLQITDRVAVVAIDNAPVRTVTARDVRREGTAGTYTTDRITPETADACQVSVCLPDNPFDPVSALVPASISQASPSGETLSLSSLADIDTAQRAARLHLQRRLLRSASIRFVAREIWAGIDPDDTITIDDPLYGQDHRILVDEVNITPDLGVEIAGTRYQIHLDNWGDYTPGPVNPEPVAAPPIAWQVIVSDGQDRPYAPDVTGLSIIGQGADTIWRDRDLRVTWHAVTLQPQSADAPAGQESPTVEGVDYQVQITTPDGVLRREFFTEDTKATYGYEQNREDGDGAALPNLVIRVWARDLTRGVLSRWPAILAVENLPPRMGAITPAAWMSGARFRWEANTESDFARYDVQTVVAVADEAPTWPDIWEERSGNSLYRFQTDAERLGGRDRIHIRVRAVDSFGLTSEPVTAAATVESLNIQPTDIDDFSLSASKMFSRIPVLEGDNWSGDGSTTVGWSAHSLYYNGVRFAVAAGDTTAKYIWFSCPISDWTTPPDAPVPCTYQTSDTHPADAGALGEHDFIIASNVAGTYSLAWNGTANQVIGSAYIMDAAINDLHVSELSADKIRAGTILTPGVKIGGGEYGDGIAIDDLQPGEAGATAGADWDLNLTGLPQRFWDTEQGAGLYLTPNYLGYYDGAAWADSPFWVNDQGQFQFRAGAGRYIKYDGDTLKMAADEILVETESGLKISGAGGLRVDGGGSAVVADGGEILVLGGGEIVIEGSSSNPGQIRFRHPHISAILGPGDRGGGDDFVWMPDEDGNGYLMIGSDPANPTEDDPCRRWRYINIRSADLLHLKSGTGTGDQSADLILTPQATLLWHSGGGVSVEPDLVHFGLTWCRYPLRTVVPPDDIVGDGLILRRNGGQILARYKDAAGTIVDRVVC